jgi:hypothetical protein
MVICTCTEYSAMFFLQSSELGPLPPPPMSVSPPPLVQGGGPYSPACEGVILRSWCDRIKWPYGVKKISIKLLWPVKVTLKVIKRRPKTFCWSCDGVPLKWNKKIAEPPVCHYGSNEPTLASQFEWSVNTFKGTQAWEFFGLWFWMLHSS